jgi:tRNA threonylcarbamoyladenosine biosynthesis protein TsaE
MKLNNTADGFVIDVASEAETDEVGRALGTAAVAGTVIGLVGTLGAGKTRLARAIAGALGVDPDLVLSPTYVLIHEYEGELPVYHFDAYRLGGPEPFEALGAAEYWDAGGVCLVEWADLVAGLLPNDAWRVAIETTGTDSRRFVLTLPEPAASRLDSIWRHNRTTN